MSWKQQESKKETLFVCTVYPLSIINNCFATAKEIEYDKQAESLFKKQSKRYGTDFSGW